jgi:hypothetical protein
MTTVDLQISTLSYEECKFAMDQWTNCRSSFYEIKKEFLPITFLIFPKKILTG